MKKLKLKLDGKQMLTKEQMKSINGSGEFCTAYVKCVDYNWNYIGSFQAGVYCDLDHISEMDDDCSQRFGPSLITMCSCES
jgi:hypothetical protein